MSHGRASLMLHALLFPLAAYFYHRSLAPCPHGEVESKCVEWLWGGDGVRKIIVHFSISCVIINYLLIRTFFLRTLPVGFCLAWPATVVVLYSWDGDTRFSSHGGVNRAALILVISIVALFLIAIILHNKFTAHISRRWGIAGAGKYETYGACLMAMLLLVSALTRITTADHEYYHSPGHTPFDTTHRACTMQKPKLHLFDLVSGVFNVARFSFCSSYDVSWIPENVKSADYIALPLVNSLPIEGHKTAAQVQSYLVNNVREVDNSGAAEVTLRAGMTRKPKLNVKAIRNETMVRERRKILDSNKHGQGDQEAKNSTSNIIILFLDAVSRPMLKRKLPKVYQVLNSWSEKGLANVTTFFRFNSIAYYTVPNLSALNFGAAVEELKKDVNRLAPDNLFTRAQARGYVTGFAQTLCQATDLDWTQVPVDEPHDHRYVSCDPNLIDGENPFDNFKGPFSIFKRCMYGRYAHQYALDYALSFWRAYHDMPKLLKVNLMEAHEGTAELIQYSDDHLAHFLIKVEESLPNTVIFLLSDHGNHMHGVFKLFSSREGELETRTPMLNIVTPATMRSKLPQNANMLVSMFDVHATVRGLLGDTNKSKFRDLINQDVEVTRTCAQAGISDSNCQCAK